jgi:shikimate kinase
MKNNIVFIGMPGCGKSSVGVIVAKALGMSFLDVDLLIQEQEGKLLQEIINTIGNQSFLELEADVVCSLKTENSVISPGGSAVLTTRGGEYLKKLGTVIYLNPGISDIKKHLSNLSSRGVAMESGQTIEDVFNYRQPFYQKYADITIHTAGQTLTETVESVLAALQKSK